MGDLEKITGRLNFIDNSLLGIQESIHSISMPEFYEEKHIYSLFPDFIQDFSLYPDFDWSSIDAEVIRSDRFGATVVLYRKNIFKREIVYPEIYQPLEVRYLSYHRHKGTLITFKDLEIDKVEEVNIAKLPLRITLKILKDSLSSEELEILISKANEEIKEAEQEYDLIKAAELKYGVITDLEIRIEELKKGKKVNKSPKSES